MKRQRRTTQPGFTYLADFFFKLKPPSRDEDFGTGLVAEKTLSPSRAKNGVIDR
jgi:hypothetical protein